MDHNDKKAPWYLRGQAGQALTEYVLIAVLVIGALIAALLMTGPVLGNIFSSVIFATIGDGEARPTLEDGPTAFWLTVTWVATQTPQETPFPTNQANPQPTDTPEDWIAPTLVPPEPTDKPEDTPTVEPSPTPPDLEWDLPFEDSVENRLGDEQPADWYRLASSTYLGQDTWEALYWRDKVGDNTYAPFDNPENVRLVEQLGTNETRFLSPLTTLSSMDEEWFSARYTRTIFVYGTETQRLGFRVSNPEGGARVFFQSEGGLCGSYRPPSNARNTTNAPIDCLVIDEWKNAPADDVTAFRDFAPGPDADTPAEYKIFVEYYQQDGAPNLEFEIFSPQTNRDDAPTAADPVDCRWDEYEGERTNTRDFSWSYAIGLTDMPNNSRCHLELRGSIELANSDGEPATFSQTSNPPRMTFWHIWDLDNANVSLQVAPYDRGASDPITALDGTWQTVWNGPTASANYEWTHETVTLTGFTPGQVVTYRFVIESNGNGRKIWYVDDIYVGNEDLPDLTNPNPVLADTVGVCDDRTTCDGFFDMNDADLAEQQFRTTGRWAVTTNAGAVDGMAWEDDPGNSYSLEDGGDRIYYIEFDKRIDVSDTSDNGLTFNALPADVDGDEGPPLLSFWQTYNLGNNASLEVQYFDDGDSTWKTLRTIVATGASATSGVSRNDKHYFEVPLNEAEVDPASGTWDAWWNGPIRLRFAMIISPGATTAPNGPGWTLDNILIERLGAVDYIAYPLYDSAGDGDGGSVADSRNNWLRTGFWEIGTARTYGGQQFAFSDSPSGDYTPGTDTRLELRAPIDLNSDTAANPASQACDASLPTVDACDPIAEQQQPAQEPTLSFWWNRDLGNSHTFVVEIRPDGGAGAAIPVWEYQYDPADAYQPAWERVEVALYPFLQDTAADNDDDIIVTFRLNATADSSSGSAADGIWIDEIRIEDGNNTPTFILGTGTNGGNGRQYIDRIDERTFVPGDESSSNTDRDRWWERWHLGGNWFAVIPTSGFNAKSGIQVMHESLPISEDPFDASNSFRYETNTFQTLEMVRHIDLTNLNTVAAAGETTYKTGGDDASPVLSWWQRFDKGSNARLRVQIAAKDPSAPVPVPAGPLTYGQDELFNWTEWENVYITPNSLFNVNTREYQWVRQEINLENATIYDETGAAVRTENYVGKIVRLRFVLDANDVVSESDVRDGWFIDDVSISSFTPRIFTVPFRDNGESMANWTAEGTWGLDVEHFRGGSDIPSLGGDGGWNAKFLNCTRRPDPNTGAAATSDNNSGCNATLYETLLTNPNYRNLYLEADDPLDVNGVNDNTQWYSNSFFSGLSFDINFDSENGGRPLGTPNDYNWSNNFTAEFTRTITISEPYRYLFYTRSDDGARVGITPFPTTTEIRKFEETASETNTAVGTSSYQDTDTGEFINYNNVINAWNYQGPTVFVGSMTLVPNEDNTPRDYQITVHYFEQGGGAVVGFGMSGANASYSDSPMVIPSNNREDRVPANFYSDTALTLDGLIDLRGTNRPILQFYTIHEIDDVDGTFYLQVSGDGGFTWNGDADPGNIDEGLDDDFNLSDGTLIDVYWTTTWTNNNEDWVERTFNLSDYNTSLITMRYRLKVEDSEAEVASAASNVSREYNGVNIASILVFDVEPSALQPVIVSQSNLDVFVELNAPAQLEVIASGRAPLRYDWYRSNVPITDPNNIPPGATLVATNVTSYQPPTDTSGTDKYWVIVSNSITDTDPNFDPVIASPYTVSVVSCLALNQGDCGSYRLDFNGRGDMDAVDLPAFTSISNGVAGDVPYLPNSGTGISFGNNNNIFIPGSHNSPYVQAAINDPIPDGGANEDLYEWYIYSQNPMTWELPAPNGAYVVSLYMADKNGNNDLSGRDNGRFTMQIEGTVATDTASGSLLQDVSLAELIRTLHPAEQYHRRSSIIEAVPVTVNDGNISITITPTESLSVFISGLEIRPILSDQIQITQHPGDRTIASGLPGSLTVRATGLVDTIAWYEGPLGDTSTLRKTTPIGGGLTHVDTLDISGATANTSFWVRLSNGGGDQVDSDLANITVCNYDPNILGSCNRWLINAGVSGATTVTATDGTVWHAYNTTDIVTGVTIDDWGFNPNNHHRSDGNTGLTNGNVDLNHVANGASSIFATYTEDDDFGYRITGIANGTYTVKLYFHDPDNYNHNQRRMDISLENLKVANDYSIWQASGDQPNHYRVETYAATVLDGELRIWLNDQQAQDSVISAIEVFPQSAN
jgi:hypothetical protein